MTKNWKKNYSWKFFYIFFWSKTSVYLSLGLHKVYPSYRRSLQFSKEAIQHFKTWTFTNYCHFLGSFLPSWIRIRIRIPNTDPDPRFQLNTDPIRIRIRIHNPVTKNCSTKCFYPNNCQLALRNMGWGSGIRDPEKTYPGSRGQKSTGSRVDNRTWLELSACSCCLQLRNLVRRAASSESRARKNIMSAARPSL